MKLITNLSKVDNHYSCIADNLADNSAAYFAIAFLKMSGLNVLMKHLQDFLETGGSLNIIAGQNFALTEPQALRELRTLFQSYSNAKLYLAKAKYKDDVFHPKLYLFKSRTKCSIVSGSANITRGGLLDNKEASLLVSCNVGDKVWIESKDYFDKLIDSENADEVNLLIIKQYETYFEQQKTYNKQAKPIPIRTKEQLAFNYSNLLKHFKGFDTEEREAKLKAKILDYKNAKRVLDEIVDSPRLTQSQFQRLLDSLVGRKGEGRFWHSGSLFRLRNKVYPYFKEFRDLVRYIRDNKDQPANIVFWNAKKFVGLIDGAAINYVAEIMMTYNYKDFANMNNNPITVLKKEAGANIKAHSSSFNGADYEEYCELIKEISDKLDLKNMLEADSFFNEIFWKIYKRTAPKKQ